MTLATTQEQYLAKQNAEYDLLQHHHTGSSHQTAEAAHIPEDLIAKAVLVQDTAGYMLVVIPANSRLRLDDICHEFNRSLDLATEEEISEVFEDCEPGAVPPLGPAYGIETLLDESLTLLDEVYFEAGDHKQLVHLRGEEFQDLLRDAHRGYYSH